MSKYYVPQDQLHEHREKIRNILIDKGYDDDVVEKKLDNHMKNQVIPLYTKEWMDKNLNHWIYLIQNVPGGYWMVQELICQPHAEFEHYQWKHTMSYEKGNVGDETARRELSKSNYEKYKKLKEIKGRMTEYTVKSEVYVPKDL